ALPRLQPEVIHRVTLHRRPPGSRRTIPGTTGSVM
ncbi:unnamed protein product, partial [Ectocarpus sp. 6 AP-2014]